jgi:hypothetical protein
MEVMPLSQAEKEGITEMRRRLADARKRGDEYCDVTWVWHGEELHRLRVATSVLIGAK